MIPQNLLPLANHIWQSTLFAAMAALLALALRRNRAQTRFCLWFAASLKFLVPFSLLVSVGRFWSLPPHTSDAGTRVPAAVEQFGQALAATPQLFSSPVPESIHPGMATLLLAIWACGCGAILFRWLREWMGLRIAVSEATPLELDAPVPVRSSAQLMEPGVFGLFRPVLLLPDGITERLAPEQLAAIVAHELCHVSRRDNLTAALHMLVESLFWFHPIVWWIGVRMVDEREHACDEEVLRLGNKPDTYAEGILNVCRFCLESPLPCVAGVTGSNLKKRIEAIMIQRLSNNLDTARKMLLAAAGLAAIAGPVAFGILQTSVSRAQTLAISNKLLHFEVASVKLSAPDARGMTFSSQGGGLAVKNATLKQLIINAYELREFQIPGGPGWISTDHFDIEAKSEAPAVPLDFGSMTDEQRKEWHGQFKERMQSLLADRFQLVAHQETKEMPIYVLVQGKGGSKLQLAKNEAGGLGGMRMQRGLLTGTSLQMESLTATLANIVGRYVIDKTGLQGKFDWKLEWTPETAPLQPGPMSDKPASPNPPDNSGPSIFTALREQLGLKLESQKGPVPVLIIDRVEKPSAN